MSVYFGPYIKLSVKHLLVEKSVPVCPKSHPVSGDGDFCSRCGSKLTTRMGKLHLLPDWYDIVPDDVCDYLSILFYENGVAYLVADARGFGVYEGARYSDFTEYDLTELSIADKMAEFIAFADRYVDLLGCVDLLEYRYGLLNYHSQ